MQKKHTMYTSKETHHRCLVGITIGAIEVIQFHCCQNPWGLGFEESREQRADEKERRKREKRREIMREREIPGLKREERVLKNYFLSHSATIPSYI